MPISTVQMSTVHILLANADINRTINGITLERVKSVKK